MGNASGCVIDSLIILNLFSCVWQWNCLFIDYMVDREKLWCLHIVRDFLGRAWTFFTKYPVVTSDLILFVIELLLQGVCGSVNSCRFWAQ